MQRPKSVLTCVKIQFKMFKNVMFSALFLFSHVTRWRQGILNARHSVCLVRWYRAEGRKRENAAFSRLYSHLGTLISCGTRAMVRTCGSERSSSNVYSLNVTHHYHCMCLSQFHKLGVYWLLNKRTHVNINFSVNVFR